MKKILSLLFVLLSCPMLLAQTSGTSGTCQWTIDDNGLLTIRPTDGVSGTLESWTSRAPWYEQRKKIESVKVEPGVSAATCYRMFYECENLISADLSNLNTQNVTEMSYMFEECSGLTNLDLSNLNTQNVTNMGYMFYGCYGLTSLNLGNFDTQNVTDMGYMFYGCFVLRSLDLSNLNTQNVTDMGYMFYDCSGLSSLDLSNFDTQNVTDMGYMFCQCSGLSSLDLSHFDTQNVTDMGSMFYDCSGLSSLDLSHFDTQNVTDMGSMFQKCSGLRSLDPSNLNTQNVTNMEDMFRGCSGLSSLDLSHFDTQNVTDMRYMFYGCSGLSSLDLSHFDTQNVTYMGYMFYDCSGLSSLDLSNFDTQNVTDMSFMFSVCSGLTSLDLSHFDTQNVRNMEYMFYGCSGMRCLDLSHFNTQSAYTTYMFSGCSGLKKIYSMAETPSKLKNETFATLEGRASCKLIVPQSSMAAYQEALGWRELGMITTNKGTTGTCDWAIDNNDLLTIRPTDGVSGTMESWGNGDAPWSGLSEDIVAARIESGVNTGTCQNLFSGCASLLEVQWEASTILADAIGQSAPANIIIYAPQGTQTNMNRNVVIGGQCKNLVLTEGEPLRISQEFEAEHAVLTRTFSKPTLLEQSSGWESIVLPFDVTSITDNQDRPLAPFGSDKTGTHPFWLAQMEAGSGFTYSTMMVANTPYLIAMPNNPYYIEEFNITGEVKFMGENVTVQKTTDAQPVDGANLKLVPTYTRTTMDNARFYVLNKKTFFNEELNKQPAGSAFLFCENVEELPLPFEFYAVPQTAPVKGQYIPIEIENTADQLRRVYADTYGSLRIHSQGGQLIIQATQPQTIGIYNAKGMLVSTLRLQPGENRTPQLPAGIYVVGKEKYVVK